MNKLVGSVWVVRFLLCFAVLCTACSDPPSSGTPGGSGSGGSGGGSGGGGGGGGDAGAGGGEAGAGGGTEPICTKLEDLGNANIDVPAITLNGAITVNGSVPAAGNQTSAVRLRDLKTGDSLLLGRPGDASYTAKSIVPGTYDLYYHWDITDSQELPRNEGVRLKSGVELTSSQTFNVDISTITLNGAITVNGSVPVAGNKTSAVRLRNLGTGDSMLLGRPGDASYAAKSIVPGTYDVYYYWDITDSQGLPRNESVRLKSGVELTSSQTFNVDIKTITLSGAITVNGSVPAAGNKTSAVRLRNLSTGDSVLLGRPGDASYTAKQIVAGTYDVYYHWDITDSQGLPRNEGVRLKSGVSLTSSQTFNVDIPTITLSGAITVNGSVPAAGNKTSAVRLRNVATGDSVLLGRPGDASYTAKQIVAGTYDVYYHWDLTDSQELPRNEGVRLKSGVALTSSQTFNVDISTISLSGAITINGSVPAAGNKSSAVRLRNVATGDSLLLGRPGDASYVAKLIVAGTYDVYYHWDTTDSQELPRNEGVRLKSGVALTSSQTFNVDVPAVTLSGAITINGSVPAAGDKSSAVRFRNLETGDSLLLGRPGDATYVAKQIVPGTYDVYYHWATTDSQELPRNESARLGCVVIAP
ncbi:hypothetical protein [Polyangium jinanense]|uniref:Uncharacterized protein n=1 Tax=Polyangium jinanense TaxID=2829994 RepID=A0A9X4AX56_9BACT|nr:hypothetical protein [Polyangium jinanense]MDC3988009.1 hypothetical protein [Polyangium jinanense]